MEASTYRPIYNILLIHGYVNILVLPSSMLFNTCDRTIKIYISSFSIKTLMHNNTSSKTTHNIKTSLIKTMLYMLMQGFICFTSIR